MSTPWNATMWHASLQPENHHATQRRRARPENHPPLPQDACSGRIQGGIAANALLSYGQMPVELRHSPAPFETCRSIATPGREQSCRNMDSKHVTTVVTSKLDNIRTLRLRAPRLQQLGLSRRIGNDEIHERYPKHGDGRRSETEKAGSAST